jgi:hypothetical protein
VSEQNQKTYRLVTTRVNGTRYIFKEHLPKDVAEAMRRTLLPIYLKVLIEDESPTVDTSSSNSDAPSEHPRDSP